MVADAHGNPITFEVTEGEVHDSKAAEQLSYSRWSLAETAMYRFKTLLGDKLSPRGFENQVTEALIKNLISNHPSKTYKANAG